MSKENYEKKLNELSDNQKRALLMATGVGIVGSGVGTAVAYPAAPAVTISIAAGGLTLAGAGIGCVIDAQGKKDLDDSEGFHERRLQDALNEYGPGGRDIEDMIKASENKSKMINKDTKQAETIIPFSQRQAEKRKNEKINGILKKDDNKAEINKKATIIEKVSKNMDLQM